MESSVDIDFDELDDLLAPWRKDTVEVASRGVPPHITLLYPWKPPPIDASDIRALEAALSEVRRFALAFSEVRTFPTGMVYLGLKDESVPRDITGGLTAAFPAYPPYGGEFPDPTPHLTIAKVEPDRVAAVRSEIEASLGERLPIQVTVQEIVVMVEGSDGWWRVRHRHTLA